MSPFDVYNQQDNVVRLKLEASVKMILNSLCLRERMNESLP